MQQKIILALLSIMYSSTYTMEQNNNNNNQLNVIKIDINTGMPEGCVKCGTKFIPAKYLNDVVLENLLYNAVTGQVYVKTTKLKEHEFRNSCLPGAEESRNNAIWVLNSSNGKKERFFYPINRELINNIINEEIALIYQIIKNK